MAWHARERAGYSLFSHPDLSPIGESPSVPGYHRVNPPGFVLLPGRLADFHRRSGIFLLLLRRVPLPLSGDEDAGGTTLPRRGSGLIIPLPYGVRVSQLLRVPASLRCWMLDSVRRSIA